MSIICFFIFLLEKQQINKGKPPPPVVVKKPSIKEDINEAMNEELSALESHMLRLTKAGLLFAYYLHFDYATSNKSIGIHI